MFPHALRASRAVHVTRHFVIYQKGRSLDHQFVQCSKWLILCTEGIGYASSMIFAVRCYSFPCLECIVPLSVFSNDRVGTLAHVPSSVYAIGVPSVLEDNEGEWNYTGALSAGSGLSISRVISSASFDDECVHDMQAQELRVQLYLCVTSLAFLVSQFGL